ncbi:hypothetical protein M23134_07390 [Microscilla marina ATCC 23134]|uniref:Uncharacterized protein n=1 Tax=Microscilla marina ATCC 23134 TaxID=313606 RepID=A1ZEN1_MICM2|nr:hypothetical protein M23134_07390 [Microscilla marina ATCC 23134]
MAGITLQVWLTDVIKSINECSIQKLHLLLLNSCKRQQA